MNRVHSEENYTIDHDGGRNLFVFTWSQATRSMGEERFRDGCSRNAELTEVHHPRACVVDLRDFQHRPADTFAAWQTANINPRYATAGLQRLAFIHSGAYPLPPDAKGDYETRNFVDADEATAWATSE
jgi:hypothetical protein